MFHPTIIPLILLFFNICCIIKSQHLLLCESLNDIDGNENEKNNSEIQSREKSALCNAINASRKVSEHEDLDAIPDFDLTQLGSDADANEVLQRYARRGGRGGGGGGGRGGGGRFGGGRFGGGRFSSSFSRSSSGGSRFFSGSRSSSSGSRFFSRSSSSSSGSSGRFFSRSGSSSSSSSGGTRFFSRTPSSSGSGHRVREAFRSLVRKPSTSGTGGTSNTVSQHRIRDTVRSMFRSSPSGGASGSSSRVFAGAGGSRFGVSGSSRSLPIAGGGFGTSGSGSGGHVWVRTGKKFLPYAIRFGKRYYQRRKYNKGMYAGVGAGTGYYAGSRMHGPHYPYYSHNNYGYPPVVDNPPEQIEGKVPTVFYCIQEDLNSTLVNETLNAEGFGTCNISGQLVTCPVEIECQTSEADNCCEDEQGTPYCCGGPIPEEYAAQYGGYSDDTYDAAGSLNHMLNIMTAMSVVLATICFRMWHRRGQ